MAVECSVGSRRIAIADRVVPRDHPAEVSVGAGRVVAFVAAGGTRKLALLRSDPTIAVSIRAGWQWATVDGQAELIGPDDHQPEIDADRSRLLLREIFSAAGGTHDDWDVYDTAMLTERRTAVLVTPTRLYGNPG